MRYRTAMILLLACALLASCATAPMGVQDLNPEELEAYRQMRTYSECMLDRFQELQPAMDLEEAATDWCTQELDAYGRYLLTLSNDAPWAGYQTRLLQEDVIDALQERARAVPISQTP